ncbi:HAD-IB family phosphatase [Candidatus Woesearchaeota archaeon]|nr:HAD-IB family phosphatase [Candidatus Woesearchaeota archaeon]
MAARTDSFRLVVFDLDGVIFRHNNFYAQMHDKYGTREQTREIEDRYLRSDTHKLAELVIGKMWAGRSAEGYWDIISGSELNPGVEETIRHLKEKGIETMIITSAVEDIARKAQKMLGIDHVFANWMEIEDERITGRFRWNILWDSKGKILADFCRQKGIELKDVAAVGDNENDISMMEEVGLSIAFNSKSDELKNHCDVAIESNNLGEILKYTD